MPANGAQAAEAQRRRVAAALDAEVAVVGAGPTGLMAALLLARSGLSVRIFDKSPSAAKESRAFGIQARTLELFQSLGLADAFLDRGLLAAGARVFVGGKDAAGFDFDDIGRDDTPFPTLLVLPQSDTEEILAGALQEHGHSVERGAEVVGLNESEEAITLTIRHPGGTERELRAAYLIGADGAHSIVRKRLGLTFEGAPYPQTFLLADCRVDWRLDHSRFKLFLNDDAFGIYVPMKGRDYARVITTAPAEAGDARIGSEGAPELPIGEVESAFRRAVNGEVALSDPVWTSRYRVHHRGVNRYRVGRAFVAGDAAHIHSPAGGQGMNTGLQDAANLAWKLAAVLRGGAPDSLLDCYDTERRPVGERVLSATDRMFSLVTSQSGWVAGVRDALLPILGATVARSGMARARAFHFISELGIRYHEGGAVAPDSAGWSDGPPAGHRAPDAPISHRARLFDLIDGYQFHLLALSREPLDGNEIGWISAELGRLAGEVRFNVGTHLVAHSLIGRDPRLVQAENGAVFTAYGLEAARKQALYLIRPDGYVAWRAPKLDFAGLRAFVTGRFTPPSASSHAL
jgi:2-polyprenyl-6-methoxyphenol hydroxylase-like FAD-dependent oxidoreductase